MNIKHAWRGSSPKDGRPGWFLDTTYDIYFIEALKGFPTPDRAWCPTVIEGGAWWVAAEHEDELLRLLPALEAFASQPNLF